MFRRAPAANASRNFTIAAPFAWSRMTMSIPANTPEEKERVEQMKKMETRVLDRREQIMQVAGGRLR